MASHQLCCVVWGIVNEWGVTPSFITAWAEWSVSLVSLSATSLQTMTLCPSHPPPNQMQFCCFYSQLEHLSLSLFLSPSFFLCLTWTTRPFFPRHTAWIVWEDAGEKKRAWGCRDKETSGCVNALRLNVSVAVYVWLHTCDPVLLVHHNESVCVCLHRSVCMWSYSMSYSGCILLLLIRSHWDHVIQ